MTLVHNLLFALGCGLFVFGYTLGLASAAKRSYELGATRGARFAAFYLEAMRAGVSPELARAEAAHRAGVNVRMPGDEDTIV